MNCYRNEYLEVLEALIKLENENIITSHWGINNYTKAIIVRRETNDYSDMFMYEISVDDATGYETIKKIVLDDTSEYRI